MNALIRRVWKGFSINHHF